MHPKITKIMQIFLLALTIGWAAPAFSDTEENWDPETTFDGPYDSSMYYWTDNDSVPTPASNKNVLAAVVCDDAWPNLNNVGSYTGKLRIWKHDIRIWDSLSTIDTPSRPTECEADGGIHGNGAPANLWPENGPAMWSATLSNVSFDSIEPVTIWSGNYLNWIYRPTTAEISASEELAADAAKLPGRVPGRLLHPATGIDREEWRVNSDTKFRLGHDGPAVTLAAFRAAHATTTFMDVLYISYDRESRVVIELVLE